MSGTVAIPTYSLSETIRQTAVTKSELKDFLSWADIEVQVIRTEVVFKSV
jgi:hypothetical protein